LSEAALALLREMEFWRGVEFALGLRMEQEHRAAACVCAFLWWGAV